MGRTRPTSHLQAIIRWLTLPPRSDGHGGTSIVDPPVLPAGVTLQAIDGGANYYADHGFTDPVSRMGQSNIRSDWPVWLAGIPTQSDANRWLDLGWNTDFGRRGPRAYHSPQQRNIGHRAES